MNTSDLLGRLVFIQAAEKLKCVLRSAYTSDGRQESTPEHTWRLCLLAMVFQDQFAGLDFERLLKMCIVHDLGETLHGDIPAVQQNVSQPKSESERNDLITLMAPLPNHLSTELLALWDDYDNASSPEARVVKALDKLETIIQHNQGNNPANFDYAFNLSYGQKHMAADPLFAQLRTLVDEQTRQQIQIQLQAQAQASHPSPSERTILEYTDAQHRSQVIQLWETVFGYETAHNSPSLAIDKKIAVHDGLIFVALVDGAVVGTVMAGYDGHRGWLYAVAVHPSQRNNGLGTALVRFAEQALAARGCMKINLQILSSNDTVMGFYQSLGYAVEPRISMGKKLSQNIPAVQGLAKQ